MQPTNFDDTSHYHLVAAARHVSAPIEQVWEAWTDPHQLANWFTEHAEIDLRVGGRYRNSDGDEGEYLEVLPPRRLRFTWEQPDYAPGGVVAVELAPADEGTIIHVEHANVACDDAEDLEIGWNWSLDSLVSFLESGIGISFEQWSSARGM
jgi:uncharacterized protein YndB with AHSA1/START domain